MRDPDIFESELQNQQAHTAKAIERRLHQELKLEPRQSASKHVRQLLERASLDALTLVEQCEESGTATTAAVEATTGRIDSMAPALAAAIARALISDYRLENEPATKRRRLRELTVHEAAGFIRSVRQLWTSDRQMLSVCIRRAGEEASREEIEQIEDSGQWDESQVRAMADRMLRLVCPGPSTVPSHRVVVERSSTARDRMQVVVEIAGGTRLESDPVPLSVHFPARADSWMIRPTIAGVRSR